ncbi:hypothetical protein [Luteolibacter marinus]|uniref:hypothetical protein n=1 Tax=Luteolibacter marinus TaxID=2776705 RepID=UPI0018667D39|nr:hypothetical protein [Luteolibacter marinus]
MKNTATIGIAAMLVGAAGGYLAGKSGAPDNDATASADAIIETKTRVRPGNSAAGGSAKQRVRNLDEILREPGQLARMQSLMDLYAGMDASQLEAEAAKLDSLPMAQRIMASFLLFGRWAEIDPQGALAHSNTMGMGGMFVRPTILQSWASVDPENAAKYFSENPREFAMMGGFGGGRGPGGESGASVIAAEWAKLDPDAALAWANTLDGRDKSSALNSVISEIASSDPSKAAQVAATMSGDDQVRAYGEIASKWASSDFSAAEAWIQSLPADARDRAMSEALQSLAATDPEGAAAKLANIPAGNDRDRALSDIAGAWARTDPASAAAWVAQQNPEDPDDAVRSVVSTWANQDSAATLNWINSQPQGELRDEATQTFIWSNRTADPQQSIQLAESISDDRSRERSIGIAAMRWMREDREAATNYIQESTTLSDEAKQRLIEGRGGNRGGRGPGGRGR